jgi:hypothetical protein
MSISKVTIAAALEATPRSITHHRERKRRMQCMEKVGVTVADLENQRL